LSPGRPSPKIARFYAAPAPKRSTRWRTLCQAIETSEKPWIAARHKASPSAAAAARAGVATVRTRVRQGEVRPAEVSSGIIPGFTAAPAGSARRVGIARRRSCESDRRLRSMPPRRADRTADALWPNGEGLLGKINGRLRRPDRRERSARGRRGSRPRPPGAVGRRSSMRRGASSRSFGSVLDHRSARGDVEILASRGAPPQFRAKSMPSRDRRPGRRSSGPPTTLPQRGSAKAPRLDREHRHHAESSSAWRSSGFLGHPRCPSNMAGPGSTHLVTCFMEEISRAWRVDRRVMRRSNNSRVRSDLAVARQKSRAGVAGALAQGSCSAASGQRARGGSDAAAKKTTAVRDGAVTG